MGFSHVNTFIQSRNIVFESEETDESLLLSTLEKQLLESFGYSIPTFIRTHKEWRDILENSLFRDSVCGNDYKFYVTLFPASRLLDF